MEETVSKEAEQVAKLQATLDTFPQRFKTMELASIDHNAYPYVSYAPYVCLHKQSKQFYILVSETAPHYAYIHRGKIGGMLIESEAESKNVFFRTRLHLTFDVLGNHHDESVVQAFRDIHGQKMVDMLLGLDFHIVALKARDGKIVLGAGSAYFVDGNLQITEQDDGKVTKVRANQT